MNTNTGELNKMSKWVVKRDGNRDEDEMNKRKHNFTMCKGK